MWVPRRTWLRKEHPLTLSADEDACLLAAPALRSTPGRRRDSSVYLHPRPHLPGDDTLDLSDLLFPEGRSGKANAGIEGRLRRHLWLAKAELRV